MTKQTQASESTAVMAFNPATMLAAQAIADAGLGNENVAAEDQLIPRLVLLQAMSPEVTRGSEKYIEGAQPGLLMNTLTEDFFEAVYCVNLHFTREYTVWRKRDAGGGMLGSFDTEELAREALKDPTIDPKQYDIQETHNHLLVLLDENGEIKTPVLCQMSGSKLRVSRQWNSMPQIREAARFASVWTLSSKPAKAPNGAVYYNFDIEFAGNAGDALYAQLKKVYEDFGLMKQ